MLRIDDSLPILVWTAKTRLSLQQQGKVTKGKASPGGALVHHGPSSRSFLCECMFSLGKIRRPFLVSAYA